MYPINTINFEILRKGPAHNQLLSPLTEYLNLCGNFGASSVQVPWEHAQFMRLLSELRYPEQGKMSVENKTRRQHNINQLAKAIAAIFATSAGLKQSLRPQGNNALSSPDPLTLTHLRLIVSASELALLPYELSKTFDDLLGLGSEEWLSIQTLDPICITRQIRNVQPRVINWPVKPRVLLVAASPLGTVPLQQHIQAMLAALKPWIKQYGIDSSEKLEQACSEYLTILPAADIRQITAACNENPYTHVHVLAHGQEISDSLGTPFGISLHDIHQPSKSDVVSGSRFAAAICPLAKHQAPAVVTIASCDSGYVKSVTHSGGASFAHDLHKAGLPFVVASQFPLTFGGSIALVEHVYGKMLWGDHPLVVLHQLRNELYTHYSQSNHDWASIIVYESLPDTEDMQSRLKHTQYQQTRWAIDKMLDKIDDEIKHNEWADHSETDQAIETDFATVVGYFDRFPDGGDYRSEILGLKGSAYKRKAGMHFKARQINAGQSRSQQPSAKHSEDELRQALMYYQQATDNQLQSSGSRVTQCSLHWLVTQCLVLRFVLGQKQQAGLWDIAVLAAQTDINNHSDEIWAHGSLLELYLLDAIYRQPNEEDENVEPAESESGKTAIKHLQQLKTLATAAIYDFAIESTKRQLQRYIDWWLDKDFQLQLPELQRLTTDKRKIVTAFVAELIERL